MNNSTLQPGDPRDPLEALAEEFLERRRNGERVSVEHYAAAHPKLAEGIRDLFPTMLALEKLGEPNPADAPRVAFEHPERLGEFRLLREVGRGGMGIVYEAEQESLGRRVAVKVLPERSLEGGKKLERFRREARTAAALQHPSIVPIYNVGEHEGIHYLTMQLIDGVGLDEVAEHVGSRVKGGAKTAGGSAATEGGSGGAGDLELTRGDGWLADSLARALVEDDFLSAASAELSAPTLADPPETTSGTSHREAPTIALSESEVASASFANDPPPLVADFSTNASSGWSSPNVGNDYYRGVAKLGVQAAEALAYAHARGTLHRDIKPANLLLDRRGNVWITDFGLAKATGPLGDDGISRTGEFVGTLRYMAPEQFSGAATPQSDLYSLGLTLYELVAWQPAYEAPSPSELIRKITTESPPLPSLINDGVPRDLETIVLKAIAREPEHRYQTGDDLAADLRRFLEGMPVAAQRPGAAEQMFAWVKRNRLVAGLAAAVVLLGATTIATLAAGFGRPPQPPPATEPTASTAANPIDSVREQPLPQTPAPIARQPPPPPQDFAPPFPGPPEFGRPPGPGERDGGPPALAPPPFDPEGLGPRGREFRRGRFNDDRRPFPGPPGSSPPPRRGGQRGAGPPGPR